MLEYLCMMFNLNLTTDLIMMIVCKLEDLAGLWVVGAPRLI